MLNFPEQTADGYKILAKSPIAIAPCVNPNLPPGTTHLQTAPNALYTTLTIPTIWHIPGELDEHRLRQAIAELTSWWPVLGSRFVRHPTSEPDMPELALHLTALPIPYETAEYVTDGPPFPTRDVIQPTLDPFMPCLSPDFISPDSGADLVAIRHTVLRPANESVLAVCLSHTLMDGDALSRMALHLSFLYENPGAKLARPPAFLARPLWKSWPPSDQVIMANKLNLGCVVDTLSEQLELGAKILSSCEPLTVSLSAADLRHLKGRYAAEGGSSTDAVCGWLIALLERVGEVDNPKIFTIVNDADERYRDWHPDSGIFPPALVNQYNTVAAVLAITDGFQPELERPKQIAQMLRISLDRYRTDLERATDAIIVGAHGLRSLAESGKLLVFEVAPDQTIINSSACRYDWQPTFGQDCQSAIHVIWTSPRYLRIWRSNPKIGERRTQWTGGIEINFAVALGLKEPLERLLASEKASWNTTV